MKPSPTTSGFNPIAKAPYHGAVIVPQYHGASNYTLGYIETGEIANIHEKPDNWCTVLLKNRTDVLDIGLSFESLTRLIDIAKRSRHVVDFRNIRGLTCHSYVKCYPFRKIP